MTATKDWLKASWDAGIDLLHPVSDRIDGDAPLSSTSAQSVKTPVVVPIRSLGPAYRERIAKHLLALDKHSTGDGLISALQVLQTVVRSGQNLSTLLKDVTLFPQTLLNSRLQPGEDWKSNAKLASEIKLVEAELGSEGRVLIRASGTEPLLRIMVEARDATQAHCERRASRR